MHNNNKYNVMMIGPSINSKGGIATVLQYYIISSIKERIGIDYYYTTTEDTRLNKVLYYIKGLINILRNISKYKVIHIHISSWWSFRRQVLIIFVGKILNKKIIIHVHGSMFDVYYEEGNRIEKYIIRYAFNLAYRVIVLSKAWENKINKLCKLEKIQIIYNSIPVNKIIYECEVKRLNYPRIILFLGKLGKRKGVYDLIDAIKLIRPKSTEIRTLLCGDGEVEKVRKMVRKLGFEHRIDVRGWVSGRAREKVLNDAYLFVLPSYNEGLPMSMLEAMARGTPVVSTAVGGIPEVIENGVEGFLVEPGDIKALAEAMERLLTDENLWISMSKAARKKVEDKFSSELTFNLLNALYRGLNG